MPIKEQIKSIITTRQSVKGEFVGYADKVKEMVSFVKAIHDFSATRGWQQLLDHNPKLQDEWIRFSARVEELDTILLSLSRDDNAGLLVECLKRVHREYLNIGCVGPWRQGKSTVISELSNLDDYVIPRSKYEACTGTTINVFNGEEEVWNGQDFDKKGGNKAVIFFYSFKEMCGLINEYLTSLGFKPMPVTQNAETLRSQCADLLGRYEHQSVNNAQTETKKMLISYLRNVDQYVTYLRTKEGESRTIENLSLPESRQELRPFVSYYEFPDNYYEQNDIETPERIYRVLAVKNVNVYTSFEICGEDVGKIQFLDTPGIGESKIGVNEALANALRQELDIAICLKKVIPGVINTESYEFHKLLRANVNGRSPENWIFYLFNIADQNVTPALLASTVNPILDDISKTILANREQGINLRNNNPEIPSQPNHVACVDVLNENNKLQDFFYKILVEMSNNILSTDESFYIETRRVFSNAQKLYNEHILSGLLEISRSIPTFDDRETIQSIIKGVEYKWNHVLDNGQNDFNLDKSIQEALKVFYDEPIGCQFAKSFMKDGECTISDEKINYLKREFIKLESQEMTKIEKKEKKDKLIKEVIFPSVSHNLTEVMFMAHTYEQVLTHWTEELERHILETTMSLIDDQNVIKKMSDIKSIFWNTLRIDGHLDFITNDEDKWFEKFLSLLKEGGADFKDLYNCLLEFNNKKIDLREQIQTIINNTISKIINEYNNYGPSPDFTNVEGVRDAYFICMINKENRIKFLLKTNFEDTVGSQVQKAEETFKTSIVKFITSIIPSQLHVTDYARIYEQLIKFYHKYSAYIFTNDEQKEQKTAAQAWSVLVRKFI